MARANGGLSNHVKDTCRSRADRSTLIKAQLSAHNVATERGTSDKTEATRFSQCAHDQRRRLEAEDCNSVIYGGRRRIRPPHCLAPNLSRAPAPASQYPLHHMRRARVAASAPPAGQRWMWGELERHGSQYVLPCSRDRLLLWRRWRPG